MCKHILNAQVAVRAPCCRRFFDCPLCHAEATGDEHRLRKTTEMQFVCKQCKRAFRKDLTRFEEEDEYCPHCDNHFVVEAKTPYNANKAAAGQGEDGEDGEDIVQSLLTTDETGRRRKLDEPSHDIQALLDERMRYDPRRDWLARDAQAGSTGERIDEGGLLGAVEQREQADRDAVNAARNMSTVMSAFGAGSAAGGFDDDDLDWS